MAAARRPQGDGPSDFDLGQIIGTLQTSVKSLETASREMGNEIRGLTEGQATLTEQVRTLPDNIWQELGPNVEGAVTRGIQAGVQQALQARSHRGAAFRQWARDNAGTIGTIVGIAVISAVSWVIAQWGGIGGKTPKGHP